MWQEDKSNAPKGKEEQIKEVRKEQIGLRSNGEYGHS